MVESQKVEVPRLAQLSRDLGQHLESVAELQFLQAKLSLWCSRDVDLSEGEARAVRAVLRWKLIPEAERAKDRAPEEGARKAAALLLVGWNALMDALNTALGL